MVRVDPHYDLWVEVTGASESPPLLVIMGANASSRGWPDGLIDLLTTRHRVIRYDHRDTGRSTTAFAEHP